MANRFWVGGTGTWDASDTTHWAATSGAAGGQSVPGSGDAVTIDAASGAGTITVNTTVTVQSIVCGAMGMTLDFSANNNNVTLSATGGFNGSGSGTRTINLGNGTWTLTATSGTLWQLTTTTNLTFSANSSTIVYTATGTAVRSFNGGGKSYNIVSFGADSAKYGFAISQANTIATLNVTAPNVIAFPSAFTTTITNAYTLAGTSLSSMIYLTSGVVSTIATVSIATGTATLDWGAVRALTFTGGATFSATNAIDLGLNTGITITPPSGGGGLLVNPGMDGGMV